MTATYNVLVTFTRPQRFLLAVTPPVAAALLRLLGKTWRWQTAYAPGARPANDFPSEAEVYVFWHRALLMAAYRYRNLGIHILISASFDGELIARLVERLGFVPIRGSSSRGGAVALLAATRARSAGCKLAITADGPRGPALIAKPGAAAIAQRSGSTASCFHLEAQTAWSLKTWDCFQIPKPFSNIRVAWQSPLPAPSTPEIQRSLQDAVDRARDTA